jgi:head-tail adaptor
MVAPFRLDDKVTIERRTIGKDPDYGTDIEGSEAWVPVASRIWANVQDVLPIRAESTQNGLRIGVQQSRLRIKINSAITATMRVTLHNKGGRVMQIISGPAMLNDREHSEFLLEGYSS